MATTKFILILQLLLTNYNCGISYEQLSKICKTARIVFIFPISWDTHSLLSHLEMYLKLIWAPPGWAKQKVFYIFLCVCVFIRRFCLSCYFVRWPKNRAKNIEMCSFFFFLPHSYFPHTLESAPSLEVSILKLKIPALCVTSNKISSWEEEIPLFRFASFRGKCTKIIGDVPHCCMEIANKRYLKLS